MIKLDENFEKNLETLRTGYSRFVDVGKASYVPASEELEEITSTPKDVLEKYNNWYFVNGDFHYLKRLGSILGLVNELLGQELSEYMGLPTIKYDIAEENDKIVGVISKNFKNPSFNYRNATCLPKSLLIEIKSILVDKDFKCDETTRRQLTAYLLRNFFAAQKDRLVNTMYAYNNKNSFLVAPLYDYESAFLDPEMMTYIDPIISWTFGPESIAYLDQNNEYFREYVEMLYDFNVLASLNKIEETRKVNIPRELKEYYGTFVNERLDQMEFLGFSKKLG